MIAYPLSFPGLPWWLQKVKNLPNVGDMGSVPGWRRFPGGGHGIHSSILARRIPWTEEPGGLQSMGSQDGVTKHSTDILNLPNA